MLLLLLLASVVSAASSSDAGALQNCVLLTDGLSANCAGNLYSIADLRGSQTPFVNHQSALRDSKDSFLTSMRPIPTSTSFRLRMGVWLKPQLQWDVLALSLFQDNMLFASLDCIFFIFKVGQLNIQTEICSGVGALPMKSFVLDSTGPSPVFSISFTDGASGRSLSSFTCLFDLRELRSSCSARRTHRPLTF
jgi:hypothetical protein